MTTAIAPVVRHPGPTLSQRYPHLMLPIARIELSRGRHAIIDPEDFEFVSQYNWHLTKAWNTWYARAHTPRSGGGQVLHPVTGHLVPPTTFALHALITGAAGSDHVNGNGLDNRRVNLRVATASQNNQNQVKRKGSISRFKGVSRTGRGPWEAYIRTEGKKLRLGRFANEADAARAYDRAALTHFGEFAKTNEMLGLFGGDDEMLGLYTAADSEELSAILRVCARTDCGREFRNRRSDAVYCSERCANVVAHRAYLRRRKNRAIREPESSCE